ncbi:hypothetical protein, partial [Methanoculleus thermophilus]|uniref:hypothetical protein n=1 Tax=Methanoculleus thermophilus TaxID=2200 RepID=UPI003D93CB8A
MFTFFSDMKVGTKILVICLFLAIIPTLMLGVVAYTSSSGVITYPEKEKLFVQREESFGHGLFLAHEILAITGITIRETGIPGEG